MELEQTIKLFVGGVTHDTNEQTLRGYFSKYGEVKSSEILRDRITRIGRGFGFIVFADSSIVDRVLNDNHVILGKKVEVKVAKPKDYREPSIETDESSNPCKTKKIFVGGTPPDLTTEELKSYFERYGSVDVAEVRHPKGFGFVTFESEEAAESALKIPFQYLKNKRVEVKVAEVKPKGYYYNMCFKCGANMPNSSYFPTIPCGANMPNYSYLTTIPCGANMLNSSYYYPTIPYPYGYMPTQVGYHQVTTVNEWQGGFSYHGYSSFSHCDNKRSKPRVSIRPPPERVENGNAEMAVLAEVAEKQLKVAVLAEVAEEKPIVDSTFTSEIVK